MLDCFIESMTHLPILARFAIALTVILTLPPLCRRVQLPAVVGFLLAGVLFGPSGLRVAPANSEVAHFFADIGKLLLMFFAGLEIDLTQFQRVRNRSLAYGIASFATPLIAGALLGLSFGYGMLSALLIGSVFASHTLLGYTRDEGLMMWALSLPQVAATLAVALTAFQSRNQAGAGLIDQAVLNSVLVLMVVTSVLGPVLTERFGKRMVAAAQGADAVEEGSAA